MRVRIALLDKSSFFVDTEPNIYRSWVQNKSTITGCNSEGREIAVPWHAIASFVVVHA